MDDFLSQLPPELQAELRAQQAHSAVKSTHFHGGRRSVRSVAQSVDRVDQFGRFSNFVEFSILLPCRGVRDLSVSKFQLCTTLGGRKNDEKLKRDFSELFGSMGSVFRSVRSILVVVDRSDF